jgi:hypothetical protein
MRWWRVALAVVATMNLGGCGLFGPSAEVRYRITVEINTPQGVRSSSGVWSFKLMPGNIDQPHTSRFRGEAIPVDLSDGQTVFALLSDGDLPEKALARRYYPEARYPAEVGTSRYEQIEYLKKHVRNRITLDCRPQEPTFGRSYRIDGECPLLVVFRNMADPKSVRLLNYYDLPALLGRGYSLKGIHLQITDDGPTHQLADRLPWLDAVRGRSLDGSKFRDYSSLPNTLSHSHFKRWD